MWQYHEVHAPSMSQLQRERWLSSPKRTDPQEDWCWFGEAVSLHNRAQILDSLALAFNLLLNLQQVTYLVWVSVFSGAKQKNHTYHLEFLGLHEKTPVRTWHIQNTQEMLNFLFSVITMEALFTYSLSSGPLAEILKKQKNWLSIYFTQLYVDVYWCECMYKKRKMSAWINEQVGIRWLKINLLSILGFKVYLNS